LKLEQITPPATRVSGNSNWTALRFGAVLAVLLVLAGALARPKHYGDFPDPVR
jgi:hypothetical protein